MENLNNLIWTDEDGDDNNDIQTQRIMVELCLVAFCTVENSGGLECPGGGIADTAGNFFGCWQDRAYRTIACL